MIESELSHGLAVHAYSPRCAGDADTGNEATLTEPDRGTETVLLTEDDPGVRSLVRHVLEMYGYTVIDAAQGEAALLLANGHDGPVHLLVADVVMPGMNGREVAERLAERRPGVRVLYLSGYSEEVVERFGGLPPGATLLQKPFTLAALARRVREVLDA